MILADTSIWIDHKRNSSAHLRQLLALSVIFMHPWIVGELACGSLSNRELFVQRLRRMPQLRVASDDQVLLFADMHKLYGKGIGYVDMQLLASTALNGVMLWTLDQRLSKAASDLNLAYQP